MEKKVIKLITTLVLIILLIFCLYNLSFAIDSFNTDYYNPGSTNNISGADKFKNLGNSIIGVLQIIGSIISVIVLIVIGIKYMMGSAEEKAEYKKTLMPYLIGAIMVFGITNLLGIIVNISGGLL